MAFEKLSKTVTVVVSERTSPYPPVAPWPLIYAVNVADPEDAEDILNEVARIRWEELLAGEHEDLTEEEIYDAIRDGLELHFAFPGDVTADVVDFRETA